jgi:hypothetical protein
MNLRKVRRFVGVHEVPIGICAGIILCALAFALIWHEAAARTRRDVRLEELAAERVATDAKIATDRHARDAAKKAAETARKSAADAEHRRKVARSKIELRGDTATTPSGTQVLLPEISDYIRASDVAHARDSVERVALVDVTQRQDTLETDHTARETIDDERVKILEQERHPRCGLKCGAAIGAGAVILVVGFLGRIL